MKNNEQHIIPFIERLLDGAEVEWKKLGEVATLVRGNGLQKKEFTNSGIPAIHYGQIYTYYGLSTENTLSFVSLETAEKLRKVDYGDVVITNTSENLEDVGKAVVYYGKEQAVTGGHATIIKPLEKLNAKFLVYYTQTSFFSNEKRKYAKGTKVIDVSANDMAKILIPLPPLSVQLEIVRILDKFTTLEAELEAELDCRKRQYEYYRNKLLSFNILNGGGNSLNNTFILPLGEVGEFVRGSGLQKKDFTPAGVGCIHYGQIYTYYGTYAYKTKSFVSQKFAQKARKAKYGDLIIATTSENDEDVCKAVVWLGNEDIAVSSDACFYIHKMNPKYVAYYFQTEQFQRQKRKFITGAKVRRVNANDLAKIKIPILPLSEQERIVSILDKFDTLTNSISEGLPKEIELRRKQYEYYREQLLSFRH
ncbi:restriction endonuclease subunit S [Hoylesella marshii]|uniref:restriction endonuclease subunit S n=1 Tax=Hoylesella marshii TaxID=189722 RepID=UPI0028D4AF60|nr:restriction endonuclease subunit S [Hoylesella marshii]